MNVGPARAWAARKVAVRGNVGSMVDAAVRAGFEIRAAMARSSEGYKLWSETTILILPFAVTILRHCYTSADHVIPAFDIAPDY